MFHAARLLYTTILRAEKVWTDILLLVVGWSLVLAIFLTVPPWQHFASGIVRGGRDARALTAAILWVAILVAVRWPLPGGLALVGIWAMIRAVNDPGNLYITISVTFTLLLAMRASLRYERVGTWLAHLVAKREEEAKRRGARHAHHG